MIQQTPQAEQFKQQLRDSLQRETLNSRGVKIARHENVYTCGDQDEKVYFIESGQVKLLIQDGEEPMSDQNSILPTLEILCHQRLGHFPFLPPRLPL